MIRPATTDDIPEVLEMSRKFYATTSYAEWADFDDETVTDLIAGMIENHILLVADSGGLVGMIGLLVAPFMFNRNRMGAYEVVWWVDPDAQGAGVGKALLSAFVPVCVGRGCHAIQMVHLKNSPPQAAAIYERMGFAHTESSYTRIL